MGAAKKEEAAEKLPYVIDSPAPWVKVCTCCGLSHDYAGWNRLTFVGYQPSPEEPTLELRNCSKCQSTLAVRVEP